MTSEDMHSIIIEEYRETISESFETLQVMIDDLLKSCRALGATAMDEIDMRKPSELAFRIFVGNVMNSNVEKIGSAVNQVERLLIDANDRFAIYESMGDDAI